MLSVKVKSVTPLNDMNLLVGFENGIFKKFDVKPIIKDYPEFEALREPALFQMVRVEPGGYGIAWNEDLDCSEGELWENGTEIPFEFATDDDLNAHRLAMLDYQRGETISHDDIDWN